ncbi:MAG: type II toxin-antitoxin system ParD family antitoxin [Thermomicrobiales bacterium]
MSVQLAPQIEAMIQQKVETGPYDDADAVVREALRLLEDRDRRLQRLREAVAEGEWGEGIPVTPELLEELKQSSIRRAKAGERPSPDVCP